MTQIIIKVVISYRDDGNSDSGTVIVGTVSGTSISFGSEVVFNSGNTVYNSCTFDSTNNKTVIALGMFPTLIMEQQLFLVVIV